jgi:hypothetical protein
MAIVRSTEHRSGGTLSPVTWGKGKAMKIYDKPAAVASLEPCISEKKNPPKPTDPETDSVIDLRLE